jgi:tetratricopeptide (TPR) repeat protein
MLQGQEKGMRSRYLAEELHYAGLKHFEAGDEAAAVREYLRALALDPDRPKTLYNLGVIYKYRCAWWESFEYNRRARRLRPADVATLSNLAIAATALQDWATARDVWRELRLFSAPGEGPIDDDFGIASLRLNVDATGAVIEVVWARRICPARARIVNIPTGSTGFRYGDVVLHDWTAGGYRLDSEGQQRPVFNALELFEPSRFSTYEGWVEVDSLGDIEALERLCQEVGIFFEDWTQSPRILLIACSEGQSSEDLDWDLQESDSWDRMRQVGFAAVDSARLTAVLNDWARGRRRVADFRRTLDARLS